MNAETRAKDLVGAIFMSGSQWGEHDWEFAQRIIAAAITQAENDKLEEAARCAQAVMAKAEPGGCSWCAADEINTAIRALKKD